MNKNIREITKKNGIRYSIRFNRDRIFTPLEWIRFLKAIKPSKKMIFISLINTGARINEILHVKKEDIDFKNNILVLKVVKRRTGYSDGKPRVLTLSSRFTIELFKYTSKMNDPDLLFPITTQAVYQIFRRGLKKASFSDWNQFSLHNIRKTLETWLVCLNVSSLRILKHFGHSEPTAIRHYIKIDNFCIDDKIDMRKIIGDLYEESNFKFNNRMHNLESRLSMIEDKLRQIYKMMGDMY